MRYLLFGTGDYYKRYRKWFLKEEVLALLDNAKDKQGTEIDGIRVCTPEEGVQMNYDGIVILSFYVAEMKRQLTELGVSSDKIYHFYDLYRLISIETRAKQIQYFGNARETTDLISKKKILLLSQDLTLGGPAIALFHAACILKKQGFLVVYASMIDGPLRDKLLDAGIPVIVDENMQVTVMRKCQWILNYSMIICNTINFHVFLSDRRTEIPVIWWLHDSMFFYDGVDREVMQSIQQINMKIVSVGPVPAAAIHQFLPDLFVGRLLYGVADNFINKKIRNDGKKIIFTTIGYIESRKGQDLLIQAIKQMKDMHAGVVFYLVGQDSSGMAQRIRTQSMQMSGVIMTGMADRETVNKILENTDVLICPSREDPMPTVCAEAMMHEVPCLVSDAVGTAEYIHNGVDGLVFKSEDVSELALKIEWCINNYQILSDMGKKARVIYEKYFSMNVFEKSLMELLDKVSPDVGGYDV